MHSVRVVSLAGLRAELARLLQDEPLLRLRFDRALTARDAALLDDAFRCLNCYPELLRHAVHNAICSWLFGGEPQPLAHADTDVATSDRDMSLPHAAPDRHQALAPCRIVRVAGRSIQPRPEAMTHARPSGATATNVQLWPSGEV